MSHVLTDWTEKDCSELVRLEQSDGESVLRPCPEKALYTCLWPQPLGRRFPCQRHATGMLRMARAMGMSTVNDLKLEPLEKWLYQQWL